MGCFVAQLIWAVVLHNLYMGCCNAQFVWDVVVHSLCRLFYCKICIGRCNAQIVWAVVLNNSCLFCCSAQFVWLLHCTVCIWAVGVH